MLNLKRGDTAVGLSFSLMTKSFKEINLTNAVVKFNLINEDGETIVNRDATIVDPIRGKVIFYFTANEINIAGEMKGELEVIYSDGLMETFPNSGYFPIIVKDKLNPFKPPKDNTPPVIIATPISGIYNQFITITLTSNEPATIYYTLDGTNPTENSTIYTTPVNVYETKTLKFFGKDSVGNKSNIQTIIYTINSIIINGGNFTDVSFDLTVLGGTFLITPTEILNGGEFASSSSDNIDGGTFVDNTTDLIDGGTF